MIAERGIARQIKLKNIEQWLVYIKIKPISVIHRRRIYDFLALMFLYFKPEISSYIATNTTMNKKPRVI
jgi:hypothetical protein